MKWIIGLLLVISGLFWFLHEPTPTEEEVVGTYTGRHNGFSDRIELNKNHTFDQVVVTPSGEEMTSSGTWKLTHKALDLREYIFFIDEQVPGSSSKPMRTSVTFAAYKNMLIRDWDTGFYRLSKSQ